MLPLLTKMASLLATAESVVEFGPSLFRFAPQKSQSASQRSSAKSLIPKTRLRRKRPMQYTAKGHELANAFERAKEYFDRPRPKDAGSKKQGFQFYTLGAALRFAVGYDKRVLCCTLGLLAKRMEYKSAARWLIDNGIPKEEVSGLKGMKALRTWKSLWLEKLIEEFVNDDAEHTYEYPF